MSHGVHQPAHQARRRSSQQQLREGGSSLGQSSALSPDRHGSEDETDDLDMDGIQPHSIGGSSGVSVPVGEDEREEVVVVDEQGRTILNPAIVADTLLPALFSQYGPLAARHIVAYLSNAQPRFSQLPPARQRRLVVQALESKKGVTFEKVGWGRWTLVEGNVRGQPLSSKGGVFTPESMPRESVVATSKRTPSLLGTSYSADFMFSPAMSMSAEQAGRDDDIDVDPLDLDHDEDSETDEEDWKTLGADGLRSRASIAVAPTTTTKPGLSSSVAIASPSYSGSPAARFAQSFHAGCPYPMRRKSSAGVFQMKSPIGLHFQKGPTRPLASNGHKSGLTRDMQHRPSLAHPHSHQHSFSHPQQQRRSPSQTSRSPNPSALSNGFATAVAAGKIDAPPAAGADRTADADAVEALCMLSRSMDRS